MNMSGDQGSGVGDQEPGTEWTRGRESMRIGYQMSDDRCWLIDAQLPLMEVG